MENQIPRICPSASQIKKNSQFIKGPFESKFVFSQRLSSIEGHLQLNVFFHQRSSFIESFLPLKVFFCNCSSAIEGCLPQNVVFLQGKSTCRIPDLQYTPLRKILARVVVLVALGQVVMDLVLVTMCKQSQHIVCPYPKRLTISYYFMPPVTTLTLGHPPFTILDRYIGDRLKK